MGEMVITIAIVLLVINFILVLIGIIVDWWD